MRSVGSRLFALIVAVSLMTGAAGAAFAQPARHACPAGEHACCHQPRLMACCPGEDDVPAPAGTPATSRIDVSPSFTPIATITTPDSLVEACVLPLQIPNRSPGRDLTTLLGTFRI